MVNSALKLQVLLAVFLSILAGTAGFAASAAASESSTKGLTWLFNGEVVKTTLKVETEIELLLEDTHASGVKIATKCSMIQVGSVKEGAEGTITEILNLAKEAISLTPLSGLSLSCTNEENCASAKVWAVNLPWTMSLANAEVSGKDLFMISELEGSVETPGGTSNARPWGLKYRTNAPTKERRPKSKMRLGE